ncbi:MAG TPA: radical SAM protein [Sumerlaeia bacterium]|nr:radical SAM protein [Sumerlaeia bacterium]
MAVKYYLPSRVGNPLVRWKYRVLDKRRPVPEAPEHAQIQTVSGCDGNCIFCPNKKTNLRIPVGRPMDWDLYRSIVDQCLDWGVRRFSPYLMNEPMLDKQLPERVKYITDRKKEGQFTKINSHGGLLTERMAKGLLDAGLDRLNLSVHGLDPEVYRRTMGMPLERTLENIDRLLDLKRQGNYEKPRVRVCMLVTQLLEPQLPGIREYWGRRGVKINLNQLENRGKHKNIQSDKIALRELRSFDWCNRLFEQLYVLYDGRLVMCCADWEQTSVMGDARSQPLREIWAGAKYQECRERFLAGRVAGMLCDGCAKDAKAKERSGRKA